MECVEFEILKSYESPTVYFCEHEMKNSLFDCNSILELEFLNRLHD